MRTDCPRCGFDGEPHSFGVLCPDCGLLYDGGGDDDMNQEKKRYAKSAEQRAEEAARNCKHAAASYGPCDGCTAFAIREAMEDMRERCARAVLADLNPCEHCGGVAPDPRMVTLAALIRCLQA